MNRAYRRAHRAEIAAKDDGPQPETFAQYLRRRLLPYKAKAPKLAWDKENRGEGAFRDKNGKKRQLRAAAKIDRLAHIAYERRNGNERHVPKLKRVPPHVFE